MARSKNRLVWYDKEKGDLLTARLELDNGEVVKGHFAVSFWVKPPKEIEEEAVKVASLPPAQTLGSLKSAAGKPEERNS